MVDLLRERGVEFTTWEGWLALDAHERKLGEEWAAAGKGDRERIKVVPREEMVEIARKGQSLK